MRRSFVMGAVLVMAGCDAIYGLDPSTLGDAGNTSLEGPDGTPASGGVDAGAGSPSDGGQTTGMDSTVGPTAVPDGGDEASTSGNPGSSDGAVQGGCKTPCSGGTCTAEGACLLVLAQASPGGIALNAPNVFYTDYLAGTVQSVPMVGGAVQPLASGQDSPMAIVVDGTDVYWATSAALMKVNQGGGTPTPLATSQDPAEIAVDSTNIYWTDFDHGTVLSAPLTGAGPVDTLASGATSPYADFLVTDGKTIYFTNSNHSTDACSVVALPLGGGGAVTIAQNQDSTNGIAMDATRVYWANSGVGANSGSVQSALFDGGSPITIASAQLAPYGIAVDDANVYWTNEVGPGGGPVGGTVMKAPLDGGTATTLMSQEDNPSAIAVDSTSVYWTTRNDVRRLTPK